MPISIGQPPHTNLFTKVLTVTRPEGETAINNGAGYTSSASIITVDNALDFKVADKVTILSSKVSGGSKHYIKDLEVQSISGKDITFTTTIGNSGANDNDVVFIQEIVHILADMITDSKRFVVNKNFESIFNKTAGLFTNDLSSINNTIPSAYGYQTKKDGLEAAAFGDLFIEVTGTLLEAGFFEFNSRNNLGGIVIVDDTRLRDNGTKARLHGAISHNGLEIGHHGGTNEIWAPTRGGNFVYAGDMGGMGSNTTTAARRVLYVNKAAKYKWQWGEQNLGVHTANPSIALGLGATQIPITRVTAEQDNSEYIGAFTIGATITVTEAGKATTTEEITAISAGIPSISITNGTADSYTTAAVITQVTYTPVLVVVKGSDGTTFWEVDADAGTNTFNGISYIFPSNRGTNGQVLTTDGVDSVSWEDAATAGAGLTTKEEGVQVGDSDIATLDFGAIFDLTESPDKEINISLDFTELGSTTFNAGTDFTWTFDTTAVTNPTLAFGDGLFTMGNAYLVVGGNTSGQSTIQSGLIVNNNSGGNAADEFTAKGDTDAFLLHTNPFTDRVGIGIEASLAKLMINGTTDEIQLLVRGNGTQTGDIFEVEKSDGTNLFTVDESETQISTKTVFNPSATQVIDAVSDAILANATVVVLNPDGDYTLTSTPTIVNGTTGQILYITCDNAEANTVTVQDEGTLASSNLELGAASRAISGKDVLTLLYNGAQWIEQSYANN